MKDETSKTPEGTKPQKDQVAALRRNTADLYKVIGEQNWEICWLRKARQDFEKGYDESGVLIRKLEQEKAQLRTEIDRLKADAVELAGRYDVLLAGYVAVQKQSLDRRDEIDRLKKFANKILNWASTFILKGWPEDMTPTDAKNLRDANCAMANQINELRDEIVRLRTTRVGKVIDEQEKEITELKEVLDELATGNKECRKEIAELKDKLSLEEVAADVDFKQQEKEIAELRAKVKWLQTLEPWTHLTARQKLTKAIKAMLCVDYHCKNAVNKLRNTVEKYGTE
jgi:chromosome segregation ATPase